MRIKDICSLHTTSVKPQADELYYLYSLPAFDDSMQREEVYGRDIHSNKFALPNKCILFNKLNVRFKRVWRVLNNDENKLASTEFLPLVIDESKVDYQYCYYLLISDGITNYLSGQNANTSGSHKRIEPNDFMNIEINLPPMDIQKKIGTLLSNYDEIVHLNREMSKKLEDMARQIYDYWFVQFDFPNSEGRPYKSSGGSMVYCSELKREIPKDWSVCKLEELIEPLERGISYSSADISAGYGIPMINLANFDKKGNYRPDELKFFSGNYKETDCVKEMDMLFACTDLTQDADIIGSPILVPKQFPSFVYSMDLAKVEPNDKVEKMYLYYALKDSTFHRYIKPFASGTTVKHLAVKGVYSYWVVLPSIEVQKLFARLVRDIKEQQFVLLNSSTSATKQRNNLLPLLMNGQISFRF